MMKDADSLHRKVQEMIDCYKETDPLREMSVVRNEADEAEGALKWFALSALHGINNNAKKITIQRGEGDTVRVTAKYRTSELPSPGAAVGAKVFENLRAITHIEGEKGKIPLALGVGDSSIELTVKVKTDHDGEKITLKFPEK
jgi:hypothetical protein